MDIQLANRIAAHVTNPDFDFGALSSRYNLFVFHDGSFSLEPVVGSWGCGYPAEPDQYAEFHLDVPLGWLEWPERLVEECQ
jgi:hypothetical protein